MFWQKKKSPIQPPPPPTKRFRFPWIFAVFVLFWSWFVWDSITPRLPLPFEPPKLYSNQCRQDIRATLLKAIKGANHSIYLVMFGLTDRPILSALAEKIRGRVPTTIFYDTGGSGKIFRYLQGADLHGIQNQGLMHQKILILDDQTVFIGSANMTTASLKMHDNLVIGLVSRPIAKFLQGHKPYSSGYIKEVVGGQKVEIWLLPDPRGGVLTELKKKIRGAQKTIQVALFTLTHPDLVDEVIAAHARGVKTSVVIDLHSGLGASAKAVEKLKKAGVLVSLSRGTQLLHHKFVYIDNKTLVMGSANWTKAALYKNSDCILALDHLNEEQRRFMNQLWSSIESTAQQ